MTSLHPSIFKTRNNWNLLRLILAFAVIYGHAFAISPNEKSEDIFVSLTKGITWSGDLAVMIFFFISGVFITQSVLRTVSPLQFLKKRVGRIFPALWLSLILNVFFLVPVFNPEVYFKDLLNYLSQNFFSITNQHFVTDVWQSHPNKSLNGVLWSITLEARLYFVFFVCAFFFRRKPKEFFLIFQVCLLLLIALIPEKIPLLGSNPEMLGNVDFPVHVIVFLCGGILALIDVNFKIVVFAFLLSTSYWISSPTSPFAKICLYVSIISLFSIVASWGRLNRIKLKGDYSYGLYLWGWPIQQIVMYFQIDGKLTRGPIWNFLLSSIISLIFAFCSWHILEKYALAWAKSSRLQLSRK